MADVGILSAHAADVPAGDGWLGPRERAALDALHIAPRRESWRLGRFTAKSAVAAWLGVTFGDVEILAAADGAPEAWLGERPAPVSLSVSHRAGRGVVVVAAAGMRPGCDLEVIEPRSAAFVDTWLATAERAMVAAMDTPGGRALAANLAWTAKEAAAKARREGLRLDVRSAVACPQGLSGDEAADGVWRPLRVRWREAGTDRGWWRADTAWVTAVIDGGAPAPPRALAPW